VVISLVPVPGPCPSARTIVDRGDLAHRGAHALWLGPEEVRVQTSDGIRGDRPWVLRRGGRAVDGGGATDAPDDPGLGGDGESDGALPDTGRGGRQ
jgi:competence protein ComEC